MLRHAENAAAIARLFESHEAVRRVYYPGIGGMVSCELDAGAEGVTQFVSERRYFALGESLGGVKSLICHPARMTHASIPAETRAALGLSDALVRLSPGCEHPADLVEDLREGLDLLASAQFSSRTTISSFLRNGTGVPLSTAGS